MRIVPPTLLLFTLITLGNSSALFAQSERNIDSLKQVLKGMTEDDTTKITTIDHIVWYYQYLSSKAALPYINDIIRISDKLSYKKGLARGYYNRGYYYRFIERDPAKGIEDLTKAARFYKELGKSGEQALTLLQLTGLHQGNYKLQSALEAALQAADVIKNEPNHRYAGLAYEMIGGLYSDKENFKLAEDYFLQAHKIYELNNATNLLIQCKNSLAASYNDAHRPDQALIMAKEALKLSEKNKIDLYIALTNANIAEALYQLQQYDSALVHLNRGFAILGQEERGAWDIYQIEMDHTAGLIYRAKKQFRLAEKHLLRSANAILPGLVYTTYLTHYAYKELGELYHTMGQNDKSIYYYKRYVSVSDSIWSIRSRTSLEDIETRYQSEKKERENGQLKLELMMAESKVKERKLQLGFVAVVAALSLITIIIQFRSGKIIKNKNKLLSDQNQEIQSQNEEISSQNEEIVLQAEQLQIKNEHLKLQNDMLEEINREKDGLMSVVAHDLRAPLNRAKGLAGLLKTKPLASEDLVFIQKILQVSDEGLALIKDILEINQLQHESAQAINFCNLSVKQFIEDEIVAPFQDVAAKKSIEIFSALDDKIEIFTDINSLKRILENLLSNAIKFSPPSSHIFIRATQTENLLTIGIQDEGPGISHEDQKKMFKKFQRLSARPTGGENSTGLGLAIVKTLVEKLHGEIIVESDLDAGTEFIVNLPKKTAVINTTRV